MGEGSEGLEILVDLCLAGVGVATRRRRGSQVVVSQGDYGGVGNCVGVGDRGMPANRSELCNRSGEDAYLVARALPLDRCSN